MQEGGRWVTINGRHVFVRDGKSLMDAYIREEAKGEQPQDDDKIILYHGSPYDFEKFDMEKAKQNNQWANNIEGHYFSENKDFASDYGQYLYEVELTKSKTQRTGGFWEPETKEHWVSNDDNDIKILHKYKVDNSINTKDIADDIANYEKKLSSLNKFADEKKKQNAVIDWEHVKSDKKQYEDALKDLKRQYKELNAKKYKKIY